MPKVVVRTSPESASTVPPLPSGVKADLRKRPGLCWFFASHPRRQGRQSSEATNGGGSVSLTIHGCWKRTFFQVILLVTFWDGENVTFWKG